MGEQSRADMVKKTGQRNTERKLPYEKPKMTAVSLFADEVLLGCNKTPPLLGGACQSADAS
jgi:hypothetical protein